MAWTSATIKLAPAQAIFDNCNITEITIAGKTAGYKATYRGTIIEDTSLTNLCRKLWSLAQ